MVYQRHIVILVFPARGTEVERLVTERLGQQPSAAAAPRSSAGLQETPETPEGHRDARAAKLPLHLTWNISTSTATCSIYCHCLYLPSFIFCPFSPFFFTFCLAHLTKSKPTFCNTTTAAPHPPQLSLATDRRVFRGCPGKCQHSRSPFLFHTMMQRSGLC